MNLDYTDEQKALKAQIAKVLRERCSGAEVRQVLGGQEPDFHRGLWRELAKLGWLSAGIPLEYEGLGLDHVVLCAIAEELGRVLAPLPVSSSIFMAAEAIQMFGSAEQKREWLPRLGKGDVVGTFAFWEGPGTLRPGLAARVQGGRLYGEKRPVPDGNVADIAVVAASCKRQSGMGLFLVPLESPEVHRERVRSLDESRPSARIVFDGAPAEPLGDASDWRSVDAILDRAATLGAFEQVGGAARALEDAVSYAQRRYAFGRPIGGFQTIKHKLVDVFVQVELAKSNAYYAAWALSSQRDQLPIAAASALISSTRAFELAARESLHVHGGFGMTWESDCHLFYRRSRRLAVALGSVGDWRDRLIGLLERQVA